MPLPRSRRRGAAVMLVGGWLNLLLLVVQGIVLVPLYLRYLGAETYGAWAASGDVLVWLAVLDLGVTGIGMQRMAAAHGGGDARLAAGWFGTAVVAQAILGTLLALLAVLLAPSVAAWVGATDPRVAGAFALAGVATGVALLADGAGALALAVQRPLAVNAAAFVSGLAGIGVTLGLLLDGRGVWALGMGMLARATLLLLANGAFALWILRHDLRARAHLRRQAARDLARLSPVSVVTMVGNAAAGRSDTVLVSVFLGPATAAAYVLTRRAADLLSMFLARLAGAVYPGFSHLVGSGDHARAASVLGLVARLYFWIAAPAVALYIALDRTFVALWVGSAQYAGHPLTLLIGLNVLVTGWAALVLYVNGAAGNIERAGIAVFVEAVTRVGLMIVLLRGWGLAALPLAGIVTAAVSSQVGMRWLWSRLRQPSPAFPLRRMMACAVPLVLGAVAGRARWGETWVEFAAWGMLFAAVAAALVLAADPPARQALAGVVARVRGARAREAVS